MAGIYIHIPFCKTKCHYCNFYKSTDFDLKTNFIAALKTEILQRRTELEEQPIESIYFGGGTPSVLKKEEIEEIVEKIQIQFAITSDVEVTLEANPDDLNLQFLKELKKIGFNRISLGTQSFLNHDLKQMNRRHHANDAVESIKMAKKAGFENISIDLIYGLPNQTVEAWQKNIEQTLNLNVQHISAYHLTYHEGTVFYNYLQTGRIKELSDEKSLEQFEILKRLLEEDGFEHYEISNFAKNGLYSRHNKSYWERKPYLGFGPSAHSFDQKSRRWNVASLSRYLKAIATGKTFWEKELLSEQDQYNDYMITSLRTIWGISEKYLAENFQKKFLYHFLEEARSFIKSGHIQQKNGNYQLTAAGLFISDKIMENLLFVEDF